MLKLLHANLQKNQDWMKVFVNQHKQELTFKGGDFVFLRIQPFCQHSLTQKKYHKLSPQFFGPYMILQRIRQVAYESDLPPYTRIHSVFHVSLLHPIEGQLLSVPPTELSLFADLELVIQLKVMLEHHWTGHHLELLINWKTQPLEEAIWEDYDFLAQQFSDFRLEDKSAFKGGSNDRILTYQRRR